MRSATRLVTLIAVTLALVPLYGAACVLPGKAPDGVARLWFRCACRLCSLRLRVIGVPRRGQPTLFAANHVSYLDIPALGAVIDATFVAKREVRNWPFLGPLARLVRTEFIGRESREALHQTRALAARLKTGDSLIVFPEGTSTDGRRVQRFKSSLFGVAERFPAGAELRVQPVSIAYPRYATGKALIGGLETLYAWYGDMTLAPHLLTVLGLRGAEVEIRFHEPVAIADFADRKALARHCEEQVAAGVALSNGSWGRVARPQAASTVAGDLLDLLQDSAELVGERRGTGLLEDVVERPVIP